MTLLLFTESYPYDVALEGTFVEPQLPHLRATFAHVVVIPSSRGGGRAQVIDGVEVDESLAELLAATSRPISLAARGLRSRLVRRDLRELPRVAGAWRAMARLLKRSAKAEITHAWLRRWLGARGLAPEDCIGYTFWCDHATTGLGLFKSDSPGLTVVSRAHGVDLYVERHSPPYLPCRAFTLRNLDLFLPVSDIGVQYVASRYPWLADRLEVARMGVPEPGFRTAPSASGHCRLASCSVLIPVKRVDLIARSIGAAARRRPDIRFEWHHFGVGALRSAIMDRAASELPGNVTPYFPGFEGIDALMGFYRDQPVDAFLNLSSTEGIPVSIMEAVSCGIPVIATAVGGNPEIVSDENGWLVSPDPSTEEVADAIIDLIEDGLSAASKRDGSRHVWQARYDAEANYTAFARRLAELGR